MDRTTALKKAQRLVAQMTVEEKASQLRYDAPAIPRLGIPAYNWWNEALHGVARAGTATSFPQAIGMAAMFDDALLERLGDVAATEGRAKFNAQSTEEDRDIYKGLTFWSPNKFSGSGSVMTLGVGISAWTSYKSTKNNSIRLASVCTNGNPSSGWISSRSLVSTQGYLLMKFAPRV